MRISLITTVLNEESSINQFLSSVSKQTKLPDELVIVDGGSTDRTVASIKYYVSRIKRIKVRLLRKKGNRSVGRNEAIKHSTGNVIAVSDVGCILDKNWLKNIAEPFKNENLDVAAGYYKPQSHSIFEKCLATYTCVMPDKVDPQNFLPSSRSVAFRKAAWRKVGGYPEDLDTCEDLVFAKRMKKAGLEFVFAQKAIVYWPQEKNIFQAFKQFFSYAVGDGQALYIRPQTPLLFARYIAGAALVFIFFLTKSYLILNTLYLLLFFYIFWSVWKNYKYVNHLKALLYLPTLQIVSDAAVLIGMTIGFLKRLIR